MGVDGRDRAARCLISLSLEEKRYLRIDEEVFICQSNRDDFFSEIVLNLSYLGEYLCPSNTCFNLIASIKL